jgi:hypothetical protein
VKSRKIFQHALGRDSAPRAYSEREQGLYRCAFKETRLGEPSYKKGRPDSYSLESALALDCPVTLVLYDSAHRGRNENPFEIELAQRPGEHENLPSAGVSSIHQDHGFAGNLAEPAFCPEATLAEILVAQLHTETFSDLFKVLEKRRIVHHYPALGWPSALEHWVILKTAHVKGKCETPLLKPLFAVLIADFLPISLNFT